MIDSADAERKSTPAPPAPPNLLVAAQRINEELLRRPQHTMAVSKLARERLELLHAEYLADLGMEAVRLARRENLHTVDQEQVDRAAESLRATRERNLANVANTIGGLIAGAGGASSYAVVFTSGPHSTVEVSTAIALCIIGFAILAAGITGTMLSRR